MIILDLSNGICFSSLDVEFVFSKEITYKSLLSVESCLEDLYSCLCFPIGFNYIYYYK